MNQCIECKKVASQLKQPSSDPDEIYKCVIALGERIKQHHPKRPNETRRKYIQRIDREIVRVVV